MRDNAYTCTHSCIRIQTKLSLLGRPYCGWGERSPGVNEGRLSAHIINRIGQVAVPISCDNSLFFYHERSAPVDKQNNDVSINMHQHFSINIRQRYDVNQTTTRIHKTVICAFVFTAITLISFLEEA